MDHMLFNNLDLDRNQIKNVVVQRLQGAPDNPEIAQLWFNDLAGLDAKGRLQVRLDGRTLTIDDTGTGGGGSAVIYTVLLAETIPINSAFYLDGGTAHLLHSTDAGRKVDGVTLENGSPGDTVVVAALHGVNYTTATAVPGTGPLVVSASGALTEDIPDTGTVYYVGRKTGTYTFVLAPCPPILRADSTPTSLRTGIPVEMSATPGQLVECTSVGQVRHLKAGQTAYVPEGRQVLIKRSSRIDGSMRVDGSMEILT